MAPSDEIDISARPPELRHLRCFVAVAGTLHFGRAAERLGMAQPPLSQQIARLEATVGHALFTRSRAGPARVALTEAGQALLPSARRLLADAQAAVGAARAAGRGERGALRIAFVASLATSAFPAALREYRARYPDVSLTLREMTTTPMLDALDAGYIDIGIGREVVGSQTVTVAELACEPLLLALPADQAIHESPVSLRDFADRPFVLPPRHLGAAFRDRLVSACVAAGFAPRVAQEAIEWRTVLALVAAGFGITLAPRSALRSPPDGITVRELAEQQTTAVQLCWKADEPSAVRDRFVESVLRTFSRTE